MGANAFYEFRSWHHDPGCLLTAVPCTLGVGVMLLCLSCGCATELEATGGRSTLLEAAVTEDSQRGDLVAPGGNGVTTT